MSEVRFTNVVICSKDPFTICAVDFGKRQDWPASPGVKSNSEILCSRLRKITAGRSAYVHVARGKLKVNEQALRAGDGAALSDEREIRLTGSEHADVLLFDLP